MLYLILFIIFIRYIHEYKTSVSDLIHAAHNNPKVNFRYIVMPTKSLNSGPIPLNFSKDHIE
jgi:hypothetical protein